VDLSRILVLLWKCRTSRGSYVLGGAGIWFRESNVNYVNDGIIIVVETWSLKRLIERIRITISFEHKMWECYRKICKSPCDKLVKWRLETVSLKERCFWRELGREKQCLESKSYKVYGGQWLSVGPVHAGLMVKCFSGIKTVELHRVRD